QRVRPERTQPNPRLPALSPPDGHASVLRRRPRRRRYLSRLYLDLARRRRTDRHRAAQPAADGRDTISALADCLRRRLRRDADGLANCAVVSGFVAGVWSSFDARSAKILLVAKARWNRPSYLFEPFVALSREIAWT